jgi:predicted PurR-regulated permease PerM
MAAAPEQNARARTALMSVVTVLLTVAALKLSRPVTLPLVAGIFLVVLAWPVRTKLRRIVPGPLATMGAFLAILAVFAAFVASLIWIAEQVAEASPRYGSAVQQASAGVSDWLRSRGLPAPDGAGGGGEWAATIARSVGRDMLATGGLLMLMFGFFGLGLAEVAQFRSQAGSALARPQARRLFETFGEVAEQWRIYVLAKTATSALTGAVTALFCLIVGLDLAFVWGFIAFLLEYVPTIGSTIAVIPPALFAIVQFGFGSQALLVIAGIALLQIIMGNFVDPRIEGRFLTLSPVLVLFAIVFWGWLWGALGALLGVPLTAAVLIGCRHFEATRWIAEMLTYERE